MSNARTHAAASSQAAALSAIALPKAPTFGAKANAILALFR